MAIPALFGSILGSVAGQGNVMNAGDPTTGAKSIGMAGLAVSELIKARSKRKQAEAMNPALYDPQQTAYLMDLKSKQRALDTGTAYQLQRDDIKQMGALAMENARRMAGGDVGATLGAFGTIQSATGRSLNQLYGNMSLESLRMNQLMAEQVNLMALRKMQLQIRQQNQLYADAATGKKDALANIYAAASQLQPGQQKGVGTPQTTIPQVQTPIIQNKTEGYYQDYLPQSMTSGDELSRTA